MSSEVLELKKKVRKKFRKADISFAELRRIVAETTRSVFELRADVDKTTRSVFELRADVDKTSRSVFELRAEVDKTTRSVFELSAKIDQSVLELRQEHKKTEDLVRKVSKMVGNISNNNGKFAEEFFANALKAKPVFGGEIYDTVLRNVRSTRSGKDAEFDIVMMNGDKVAIIEVKYCAHPEDFRILVEKKVSEFRGWFPAYSKHAVYLGIASLSFNDDVLKESEILGVGVLRQIGDALEMSDRELKAF
jgi:predicted RNase H-like nuclease (RuvC/YqgF family)